MAKLYDGLSSTTARSLATSDPAVAVRLDQAAPPDGAGKVFETDGLGGGIWVPNGGELPEILQAIALAPLPDTEGQTPTFDGVGVTWAAPSGGPVLSGNPFIDNSGTPTALDDEFDSGSPDLAVRGWKIYNRNTGAVVTRYGSIKSPVGAIGANQYRSSLYGSALYIQTHPDGVVIVRDGLGVGATQNSFILRVGVPWGRVLSSQSLSTSMPCDAQVGLIRSAVASGTSPRSGSHHRMFFGQRGGSNNYFGYDQSVPPLQQLRDPTDAQSIALLNDVDCIWASVASGGQWFRMSLLNTRMGSHRGTHVEAVGGETSIVNPTQVGFDLINVASPGDSTNSDTYSIFMIDYFRNRPSDQWFGL